MKLTEEEWEVWRKVAWHGKDQGAMCAKVGPLAEEGVLVRRAPLGRHNDHRATRDRPMCRRCLSNLNDPDRKEIGIILQSGGQSPKGWIGTPSGWSVVLWPTPQDDWEDDRRWMLERCNREPNRRITMNKNSCLIGAFVDEDGEYPYWPAEWAHKPFRAMNPGS